VEVIHVCPRAEENFDEAGRNKVAVQKMGYGPPKETSYSYERRMGLCAMKRSHTSASEKWHLSKDSVEGREVGIPMVRKYQPPDHDRYEDGAGGGGGMQIPEIRVHHAQDGNEGI
jgi:hypothetical protein